MNIKTQAQQAAAKEPVLNVPPIPQPSIAKYAILRTVLDLVNNVETLVVQAQDAGGAPIGEEFVVQPDPPIAASTITQFTPQLYADLQVALGITGTVS